MGTPQLSPESHPSLRPRRRIHHRTAREGSVAVFIDSTHNGTNPNPLYFIFRAPPLQFRPEQSTLLSRLESLRP